jgi:hypothetical protein
MSPLPPPQPSLRKPALMYSSKPLILAQIVFTSFALFGATEASATDADQVGKVVAIQGDVRLFRNPSKTLPKNVDRLPPLPLGTARVLFEKEYYEASHAKPGMELQYGNIIRTAPGARAILVFPNGDNYTVGPSSAYRAFWKKGAASGAAQPEVALMHGRIRGVVSPGGPRSGLTVRTRTATMGVRGTDFFIGEDFETGKIEVAVQRGSVAVTPTKPVQNVAAAPARLEAKAELAKTIEIKTGEVAAVAARPAPTEKALTVSKTDKQLLSEIQGLSRVDAKAQAKLVATLDPAVAAEVQSLQKKAVETTLADVKRAQPEAAASLEKAIQEGKELTLQDLQRTTIQEVAKTAPVGEARKLPEDLAGIDAAGAYERFFNAE